MKKYFLSIALALTLLLVNSVMAQKQDSPFFNGWIEYEIMDAHSAPGKTPQKLSANPQKGAPVSASQPRSSHNNYTLYASDRMITFLCGDFYYRAADNPFEVTLGARFDIPFRTATVPVCKLNNDCELFKKIQSAHDNGDTKALASLLKKYYIRIDESRNIAGYDCVGYKVLIKGAEGIIWVAESIDLSYCMAPYIGIYHPIMEFEYCFPVKGIKPFHLVASKIVKSDEAEALSRKCILEEERINPDDLIDMIQQESQRFNR